jgi:hypothetical protein
VPKSLPHQQQRSRCGKDRGVQLLRHTGVSEKGREQLPAVSLMLCFALLYCMLPHIILPVNNHVSFCSLLKHQLTFGIG